MTNTMHDRKAASLHPSWQESGRDSFEINQPKARRRKAASQKAVLPLAFQSAGVSAVCLEDIAKADEWRNAFRGQYKDFRYYTIVENTLHPEFIYRYFVLNNGAGSVEAIQPFFVLDQDLVAGLSGPVQTVISRIRRAWPKFLFMKTLMIGSVAGEGHLDKPDVFADPAKAKMLAEAAVREARSRKAQLIVFKEFPSVYRDALDNLRDEGFTRAPSLPMASLNIAYRDFEDYLSTALSRSARKDLRRKFRATKDRPIRLEVVQDITPYIDEAYPLYLQVYNRSSLHFEQLTKDYLCELGRAMPDRTRFFIWRLDGRIIAFNLCMVHGDTLYDQYIGLDYSVALDLHLYHYTFRDIVSWSIANGYTAYKTNSLNYDPKLHLKMKLDPLDLYVRHRNSIANAVLRRVLPGLEPTRNDASLKKFANYADLKG